MAGAYFIAFWAIMIQIVIGIGTGLVSAIKRYSFVDALTTVSTTMLLAVPAFVLGYLLIYMFGVYTFQHQFPAWARLPVQGIGPDLQTPAITYDGKFIVCPFSGFQRQSSGIAFIDAQTDELVGIWPSNGGHHDCVIVPTELEHMKHTRSCTL